MFLLTGVDRLYKDIEMMIGVKPSGVWKIFWKFITPSLIGVSGFIYIISDSV